MTKNQYIRVPHEVLKSLVLTPVDKLLFSNMMSKYVFFTQKASIPTLYTPFDTTLADEIGQSVEEVRTSIQHLSDLKLITVTITEDGKRVVEVEVLL